MSTIHCQNTLLDDFSNEKGSVTLLVHKNCFMLACYDNGLRIFMLNPIVILVISTTIIKYLYTNKVNYVK